MAEETVTATTTATKSPGNGAPNDAPATTAATRSFSQEEVDTFVAKARGTATRETLLTERQQWLERLGLKSIDELDKVLDVVKAAKPTQKSEQDKIVDKMRADFESQLATEKKARLAAEEKVNAERVRSFLLQHTADTNDPDLAMSLFGIPYEPQERLIARDGKLLVIDRDGTELPHKDPAKWVSDTLADERRAFLLRPKGGGSGARVGSSVGAPANPAYPKTERERSQMLRATIEKALGGVVPTGR